MTHMSQENGRATGECLGKALQKGFCSSDTVEEGLIAVAESLDLASTSDATKNDQAYQYMAVILKGRV